MILPEFISKDQGAFIKGQNILDNVALARQLVLDIDRKVSGHNIILNLDMGKAYDRMKWDFLFATLRKLIRLLHKIHFSYRDNDF